MPQYYLLVKLGTESSAQAARNQQGIHDWAKSCWVHTVQVIKHREEALRNE